MTALVGTASWTDKTLIDCRRFYPPGATSAEARLRFYASIFPLVEVDSSYYGLPTPTHAQLWAERTPTHFTFNLKAFRLFTGHYADPKVLPKDVQQAIGPVGKPHLYARDVSGEIRDELWRRFHEALKPLQAAGKLGLVHFQFAPWVVNDAKGRAVVTEAVQRMAPHTASVEFRHRSWFPEGREAATLAWLRDLQVVHTTVDEPQGFANSIPSVWEVTHPRFALVRLHGRNAASWNTKGPAASSRFNYDYPDEELEALAGRIARLERQGQLTHVILNNCFEDQSVRNGRTLMRMLGAAG